jgi:Ca2+-binding EF-hand superfamily protein
MTKERFDEIWNAVVVNAFYNVGEDGTISHEEMIEIMKFAKRGMSDKVSDDSTCKEYIKAVEGLGDKKNRE